MLAEMLGIAILEGWVAMYYSWPTVQDLFDAVEMALADYGDIKGFDVWDNHYDAGGSAIHELGLDGPLVCFRPGLGSRLPGSVRPAARRVRQVFL